MDILILGHNGMLGHMVTKYLSNYANIITINHRWPSKEFKTAILDSNADVLINCIGAIPQRTKNFEINWKLPIWLDQNFKGRVIHPGTDCEMDNDDYGVSKATAADWIINYGERTKIIKTSIIGPELKGNASLMDWFLSQKGEVFGYTKAKWNGNTTLEWAKQCYKLIHNWANYPTENILVTPCISKYELLNVIKKVFDKDINIIPQDKGKNKCLVGEPLRCPDIEEQLNELKNYYYEN